MKKMMVGVKSALLVLSTMMLVTQALWATDVAGSTDTMAVEVLKQVNQYRASRGLSPLAMNAAASREARGHSQAMANHAVPFGHTGFNQRIGHLYHDIQYANAGAENVAYNYKTAKIVVDGWIKSPGHRQNIVGRYNLTGIGIVRDRAGKLYYTQLFVRTNEHAHQVKRAETARQGHGHARTRFFIG